ncbi:MAG: hypothetical protein JRJ85_12355 [Deltaproteobacteria bacterium]|nr:hypothetical protein [Deltaproteobacteria bacterium]
MFSSIFSVYTIQNVSDTMYVKEVLDVVVSKSIGVLDAKGALLRIYNEETDDALCATCHRG